ncbi:MAG: hypothetical protein GF311_25800 [Candidatus Lokiarchaeota archaeon]|nr:hypothetical protein [Candidatus Lokiarchaeota archaeon]
MINRDLKRIKKLVGNTFKINEDSLFDIQSREGIILANKEYVFKCFTLFNEQIELMKHSLKSKLLPHNLFVLHKKFIDTNQYIIHNYLKLKALSEAIKNKKIETVLSFEVYLIDNLIIAKMPYMDFKPYKGSKKRDMVLLLKKFLELGWIPTDLKPSNIKIKKDGESHLIFTDIGYFFVPYYEELFKTACRRAFISVFFATTDNLNNYLREATHSRHFNYLENPKKQKQVFDKFYKKIIS